VAVWPSGNIIECINRVYVHLVLRWVTVYGCAILEGNLSHGPALPPTLRGTRNKYRQVLVAVMFGWEDNCRLDIASKTLWYICKKEK